MQRHAPRRKVLVVVTHGRGAAARVLLLRRAPPRPDEWQTVTGNVDEGEDVEAAAVREAWEETGARGRAVALGLVHAFAKPLADGAAMPFEEHAFALEAPTLDVSLSHEHRQFAWAPPVEAVGILTWAHQREAVRAAAKRLGA